MELGREGHRWPQAWRQMPELTLLLRAGPPAGKLPPKSQNRASPSSLWGCLWRGGSRTSRQRAEPTLLPQDGASCSQACKCGAGICPRMDQRPEGRWEPGKLGRETCAAGKPCCDSGGHGSRVLGKQVGPLPATDWPFLRGRVRYSKSITRKERKQTFLSSINSKRIHGLGEGWLPWQQMSTLGGLRCSWAQFTGVRAFCSCCYLLNFGCFWWYLGPNKAGG